ncbi:hypothetical protein AGMMS50225_27720 [Betaproteobacteria bacterium]|nr:hypothetical protein AGMMS50225_27720 [Betaproteobacteria bacterium]
MNAVSITGCGLLGPGFDDWHSAQALLRGDAEWAHAPTRILAPELLPPAERRRIGAVVKLALDVGVQAARAANADTRTLATVFASSSGDGANCHAICAMLAGADRLLSPTRFHNSVNNASAGYWGIATGAQATSTIVSAHDGSFAAGLLEATTLAVSLTQPVLLVAYDHPYPEPLAATRPLTDAFAVALVLEPAPTAEAGHPRLTLTGFTARPADRAPGALEALRVGNPAARSLPLLAALATRQTGAVALDYLDDLRLNLTVEAGA